MRARDRGGVRPFPTESRITLCSRAGRLATPGKGPVHHNRSGASVQAFSLFPSLFVSDCTAVFTLILIFLLFFFCLFVCSSGAIGDDPDFVETARSPFFCVCVLPLHRPPPPTRFRCSVSSEQTTGSVGLYTLASGAWFSSRDGRLHS